MNKNVLMCVVAGMGLCTTVTAQNDVAPSWPAYESTVATKSTSTMAIVAATAQADVPASSSFVDKLYFTTDVGLNWVPDFTVKDFNFAVGGINLLTLTNLEQSTNMGVRWDIGIGYELTDNFRIQLESGIFDNSYNTIHGTVTDPFGFFGVPGASASGDIGDLFLVESGSLTQVPVMVSGIYEFHLGDGDRTDKGALAGWRFSPYIGGGIGAVYLDSDAKLEGLGLDLLVGGTSNSIHIGGNDWVFGYQIMAGLEYEISNNWFISIGYRFLGLTEADFGEPNLNGVTLSSVGFDRSKIKTEAIYNHSLQFGLRIEF